MTSSNPPPQGWTKEFSKSQNREYFYHAASRTSKWTLDEAIAADLAFSSKRSASGEDDKAKKAKLVQLPKVAIIVPYRDDASHARKAQLDQFCPHMHKFLGSQCKLPDYRIYIIEQGDKRKFNRGKLLNIGFMIAAKEGYDSFIFHDVDLLPQPPLVQYYSAIPHTPIHIAKCWSRYNKNPEYLGGIVSFSKDTFESIRGFPNIYWGWGGEDDELKKRVTSAGLEVQAPPMTLDAIVDLEHLTLEEKLAVLRTKKDEKCNVKWEVNATHDEIRDVKEKPAWWGLPVEYTVQDRNDSLFEHTSVIRVDIGLNYSLPGGKGESHWTNEKV